MRRTGGGIAIACAAAVLAAAAPAVASTHGGVRLAHNVPRWAMRATPTGRPATGSVTVSVHLRLRHEAALKRFIAALNRPGSRLRPLTAAQFRRRFAPTRRDLTAVRSALRARGLRIAGRSPANRTYVDARGSVRTVERAFGVRERMYRYRGMTLRAARQNPRIPRRLARIVRYIGGLDQTDRLIRPAGPARDLPGAPPGPGYATPGPCSTYWGDHTATATPQPAPYDGTLPWTPCGYTPPQIRAAYGVPSTYTGKGVTVGITDAFASPTIVQDVNRFSDNYGLPRLNSSNFVQLVKPGTYNFPPNPHFDPQGWYGEESLDVEWVHAIAPDAKIVYAGAQNSVEPLDHALIDMIDKHRADIITNSWGIYGEPSQYGHFKADEQAFEQAAATGISVLFSSGDDGDVAALTGLAQGSWPATSPYVTAVGGTSLALRSASGDKDEWGWGTYTSTLQGSQLGAGGSSVTGTVWSPWPPAFLYGSGGGISVHFAQPDYQKGVVPNAIATTTTTASGATVTFTTPHRVTPDISMVGDPNTGAIYGQTYDVSGDPLVDAGCVQLGGGKEYCERRIGGTSLSSPLMAGVLALVNQARFAKGKGAIGFANPALYAARNDKSAIRDVLPPAGWTAVLRQAGATGQTTTLRTMNSGPDASGKLVEGADSSLRTTSGWDDVTGIGTPVVPGLITALSK